jgi:hypothetical protein
MMKRKPDVPEVDGIDLDYTPAGYFVMRDLHLALPSDIKGKARRDLARKLAAEGSELPPELAAPELTPEDRQMWGAIHPAMMGGEYLPRMRRDEVEIARISLKSVTGDQISVRARRRSDRIVYAIVDEYQGEYGGYELHPQSSRKPLSMRQLVDLLDRACEQGGAVMSPVIWPIEDGSSSVDDMRGFVTVESDFYPELGSYYEARFERYFAEHAEEAEDDSDG